MLHPEPLQPTKTPDYPWQRVGMDLFEWKGHQYLLVVDYFSQWIEIAHLTQTTSSAVIKHVKLSSPGREYQRSLFQTVAHNSTPESS